MKSSKQRRAEIMAHREARKERKARELRLAKSPAQMNYGPEALPVDQSVFPSPDSYLAPPFAVRGYYLPQPFTCKDCEKEEIWTAAQQKWWYEKARGHWNAVAVRCRACRAHARVAKRIAIEKTKQGLVNHENNKRNR